MNAYALQILDSTYTPDNSTLRRAILELDRKPTAAGHPGPRPKANVEGSLAGGFR